MELYEKLGDQLDYHRTLANLKQDYEETPADKQTLIYEEPLINFCSPGEHELTQDADGDFYCENCDYMPTPYDTYDERNGEDY